MRIAIIGTGISGLTCAHVLGSKHDVTVFEAADRPGGHTNTVRVDLADETHWVDTGFLVFNEQTYPGFTRLLRELRVDSAPSEMSFSVTDEASGVVWRGSSPNTVFAQRRNLARAAFWRMLVDIGRFNRRARALLAETPTHSPELTLADLLAEGAWSQGFLDCYLIPLGSSIWSANPATFLDYPAVAFARFFDNHGLLRVRDPIPWRTIPGGARRYVEAIATTLGPRLRLACAVEKVVRRAEGVELRTSAGEGATFDQVIVATHSPQALMLVADLSSAEREILGAIRYQTNEAVLHTDTAMLPGPRRAWASWNYYRPQADRGAATLTYLLNRLQNIDSRHQICVTLNRTGDIRPERIVARIDYEHPVFDQCALRAQGRLAEINGRDRVWFCGAYWGNGFHEDGVSSARNVCAALGVEW